MAPVKTYTYKELIDLYIRLPAHKHFHPDYDAYYTGLGSALEQLFEIDLFKDEVRKIKKDANFDIWPLAELFDDIVRQLRSGGIGRGWLEGGPLFSLEELAEQTPERALSVKTYLAAKEQEKALRETYRTLLYQLFDILYGKTELVFTSKDLLSIGFDGSKEPNIRDYFDFI